MDYLALFSFIRKTISVLHWLFYGLWIIPIIINAETWFYGVKFSGEVAITIHFVIGVFGIFLGYLIYKKYKFAYVASILLFGMVLASMMFNHLKS